MRGFLKPMATFSLAIIALAVVGGAARADQSADAIISALKPTGNLATGATRGIKLGGSSGTQTPSSAQPASATSAAPRPRETHGAAPVETSTPAGAPSVNLTVNFPTGSADLT